MTPQRIVVLFAHPALQSSRVNRAMVRALEGCGGIALRDLYELYPDFHIDVKGEQACLVAHDIIVFQHPLYWYSTPALLKEWQDLVLEHGWAYGHAGQALRGKRLLCAVTAGGSASAYQPAGLNRLVVRQFLAPIEYTARLCGMRFLAPFVVHGTHGLSEAEIARVARDYRRTLEALRDGLVDLERAERLPQLNHDLDSLLHEAERARDA